MGELAAKEKVESFLEKYPNAEFGPGHVVLSDYNWGSIDFCLDEIENNLSNYKNVYDREKCWEGFTEQDFDAEIQATKSFLENLKEFVSKNGF